MPEPGYTIRDTPRVVRRIENDLAKIRSAVQQADPGLRSLVLTGGFARGEGAVIEGVPQNDYDLVAVRGRRRPHIAYRRIRADLEAELGIHVDLAPVQAWRLPFVSASIFWYETALRHRLLWGEDLMRRVRVRRQEQLDPAEGLRLLVNRAAGLLFVTALTDPHEYRIQAAKALLAVSDVHLLAHRRYRPSQLGRQQGLDQWRDAGAMPPTLAGLGDWLDWAFAFKVDPVSCSPLNASTAWRTAAQGVLQAVPVALDHAGFASLEEYAQSDGVVDHVYYFTRSRGIEGGRRFAWHPTGRIRLATLRLLEASLDGEVPVRAARRIFGTLTRVDTHPLGALKDLREATLQ